MSTNIISAFSLSSTEYQMTDAAARKQISDKMQSGVYSDGKYNLSSSNLSVVNISADDFYDLIGRSSQLSDALYIVQSDNINAYGTQIKNLAEPILSNDAATKNYVDKNSSAGRYKMETLQLSAGQMLIDGVQTEVLSCQAKDLTMNTIAISSSACPIVIAMPQKDATGARNFLIRVECTLAQMPPVMFVGYGSEMCDFESDDDSWAALEAGVSLFSFTESRPRFFTVRKMNFEFKTQVHFDVNGGQSVSENERKYTVGKEYGILPTATPQMEYMFIGWFTEPEGGLQIQVDDIVTADVKKLYAQYIALGTKFNITTTSNYKEFGIYSAERADSSSNVIIDWGDGTTEEISTNITRKYHVYANPGDYVVKVSNNIKSLTVASSNSTYYSKVRNTLKSVEKLGSKITSLGSYCFTNCSSLQSITIPDSVTSIGDYCFSNCSSLQSITIPDSVTSLGSYCFNWCSSFQSITIPDSVTSIGIGCFSNCSSLQSITIPDSVTSLGSCCFYWCSSLQSITISGSVTSIGSECFYRCSSLQSITIPDSVTSLGSYCFYWCSSL